jgi:hypothetical protein
LAADFAEAAMSPKAAGVQGFLSASSTLSAINPFLISLDSAVPGLGEAGSRKRL